MGVWFPLTSWYHALLKLLLGLINSNSLGVRLAFSCITWAKHVCFWILAYIGGTRAWTPAGMGNRVTPFSPPWKCKMFLCCKCCLQSQYIDEVFRPMYCCKKIHVLSASRGFAHRPDPHHGSAPVPLDAAGGRPSFRPPHYPPLKNILRSPVN